MGYYCEVSEDTDSTVQCLQQDNGCIYPYIGCTPPYNFIASKVFKNPFNRPATAHIVGSVDDDCLLEFRGQNLWLRSGDPDIPSCTAGTFDYTIYLDSRESFRLTGYDILGICGNIDVCVTFS